ncbi:hypothetical protein LTR84_013134 [Exophiala bonariae]|uniref:DUF6594 domain-containing protein n=1 Tax=Exophiala bonariae TaxID=1690606 RepID=A0AAV9NE55_9EURO|nr:hypothetical protein LTR84_013134 [Exophiala bonariae]
MTYTPQDLDLESGGCSTDHSVKTATTSEARHLPAPLQQLWSRLVPLFMRKESHQKRPGEIFKVRKIKDEPHGWPKLSAVIDSDTNFMIYRRFGWTRTRLLTYHQDVVREMEDMLGKLDRNDFADERYNGAICWRAGDDARDPSPRKALLENLTKHLQIYDDLLLRSHKIYLLDSPSAHNRESVANAIFNDAQFAEEDASYIEQVDDLVTFCAEKEATWVHRIAQFFFKETGRRLPRYLFRSKIHTMKTEGVLETDLIDLFSKTAHEVFAATAGYCAVLVVFTAQNTAENNH